MLEWNTAHIREGKGSHTQREREGGTNNSAIMPVPKLSKVLYAITDHNNIIIVLCFYLP